MSVSHESDSPSSLTATRRLSDDDVRSIFESLHHSIPAPCHLKFKIIPVGPNGLKLSPPAYEFEGRLKAVFSTSRSAYHLLGLIFHNHAVICIRRSVRAFASYEETQVWYYNGPANGPFAPRTSCGS